ncbi:hypothetical protein A3Q56_02078 [Intoshia linei]|uniref:Uncharacterized protein n=1 Tax=Intoshia linei TaxID=1819745 RepID=A0A177B945_9BILA|nr:hypothetical protein A3Q56_02078 [Intoshia linei]
MLYYSFYLTLTVITTINAIGAILLFVGVYLCNGKRSLLYYGTIHLLVLCSEIVRLYHYFHIILNDTTDAARVFSGCMVGPCLLTAVLVHSYGLCKIISSKYRIRRVYSSFVPLIVFVANVLNMFIFIIIYNYANVTTSFKNKIMVMCAVTQIIIATLASLPYFFMLKLFRIRMMTTTEILDSKYLSDSCSYASTGTNKLTRHASLLDGFKLEIDNKSKLPFFIKSTLCQVAFIFIFILFKIYMVSFYAYSIYTETWNPYSLYIMRIVKHFSEAAISSNLLSYSLNNIFTKIKKNRKSKL